MDWNKKILLPLTYEQFLRLLKEIPSDHWLYPTVIAKAEAMERHEAYTKQKQEQKKRPVL